MAARGKSTRGGGRKTEATPERPPLELVVGFDAEWVNSNRADDSLPTTDNVLISWQLAVVLPNGKLLSRIFYAEGDTRRHRLSLIKMLSKALFDAWQNGDIKALPPAWRITIAGHFLRADLTTVREFRKLKTRVDSVRKTFTTVTKPIVGTVLGRKATIYFADTLLLSPQGSSLKKLGEVIGRPKVELPDGAIERMDLLRKNDPALFEKYAVEDAIIAALYYLKISEILQHELGVEDRVATLGGAGVHMIKAALAERGLAPDRYFGCERREGARHWLSCLAEITPFAANCYHGARNEAYRIGFTPTGTRLYDLDLRGAYTTAMALMRVPDWESAHATADIEQLAVIGGAMTFARVRFEFPADTRYPSLPVRAGARGLVYPLRGVSWCGGAELVVALAQGAKIEVDAGWRVEWEPDSPRPFEAFTRRINDIRKRAKAAGNTLLDQTAKEIGISAYGKIAQVVDTMRSVHDGGVDGVRGKRVFDTRAQSMKTLPSSKITNRMMAAFTTSMVRAMISEALARLPADAVLATATTDGFLSSVPVEKLDMSGPLTKEFAAARARISLDDPGAWEEKHRIGRALVTKTRGTITIEPFDANDPGKPVLARAGYKLERKPAYPWEECAEWRRVYAGRDYETISRRKSLTSLRKQCLHDMDLVEEMTNVRLNMDFDMKREPIDPFDHEGLLCSDTRPWETLEQFMVARDGLEAWKKAQRRVLRTLADYRDKRVWTATREGQRASGSTAQSGRPPLVNAFIRAATRGELSPCRWTYGQLAALLSQCGVSANIDTLKNAKRRGELALGQIHELTAPEIQFAESLYRMKPECPLDKLVAPNSPAATDLAALRSSTICDHCGAAFARQRATARFCSTACRVAAGRQLKKSA